MLCVLFYFYFLAGTHTCVLQLLICAATKWRNSKQNCVQSLSSAGTTRTVTENSWLNAESNRWTYYLIVGNDPFDKNEDVFRDDGVLDKTHVKNFGSMKTTFHVVVLK